jgi:hypothetical protein
MDNSYKLVSLASQDEVIKDITKYENELEKKVGQDIVLIAYTKDTKE